MVDNQRIIVGRVSSVYGIKGWVKITSFTDPGENIFEYHPWYLNKRGQSGVWHEVEVDECKASGKGFIAHIVGVDDREIARELTGSEIAVARDQLPRLDEGEYYWSDLMGLTVVTERGQLLGKVHHFIETGANDVMVVRATSGSLDDRERLIPYLPDQVVKTIDLGENKIVVDWDIDF